MKKIIILLVSVFVLSLPMKSHAISQCYADYNEMTSVGAMLWETMQAGIIRAQGGCVDRSVSQNTGGLGVCVSIEAVPCTPNEP